MVLRELIEALEAIDPETSVPIGFSDPHSYRGYYDDVAFHAESDTTVGAMLASAKEALGSVYDGYKGGRFTMEGYTPCWLAEYGYEGETIGPFLLKYMVGEIKHD